LLRALEKEPAMAPQALGATRSLERMRQKKAAEMLEQSRLLSAIAPADKRRPPEGVASPECLLAFKGSLDSIVAPPPISEVLHDVYKDEQLGREAQSH
jgi:hypothetical protein